MIFISEVKRNHKKLMEENARLKKLVEEERKKCEQWEMLTKLFEKELKEARHRYNLDSDEDYQAFLESIKGRKDI